MKNHLRILCSSLAALAFSFQAHADLGNGLQAHFTFDTADSDLTDGLDSGLLDASGHNIQAFRISGFGTSSVPNPNWTTGANPSGPGFAGNAAFDAGAGAEGGISDRSSLLMGKALNIVDARNEAISVPVGTSTLGQSFSISVWQYFARSSNNTASSRFFVFEDASAFDVSWGTAAGTPAASSIYNAYIASTTTGGITNISLSNTGWHNIVHTISQSGTNSVLRLYIDGAQVGGTMTQPTANMNFTNILFGRQRTADNTDRDWDGLIDDVGLWNRVLTTDEISEVYTNGLAGAAVPEPASATLAALAGGLLLARRRRHTNAAAGNR